MDRSLRQRLDLAGVDTKKAIERFMGNDGIYEEFLVRFLSDKNIETAEKALSQGNYKEAEVAIHNLKGISGSLGMDRLSSLCLAFMETLRKQTADHEREWSQLQEEFYAVCGVIGREEKRLT